MKTQTYLVQWGLSTKRPGSTEKVYTASREFAGPNAKRSALRCLREVSREDPDARMTSTLA